MRVCTSDQTINQRRSCIKNKLNFKLQVKFEFEMHAFNIYPAILFIYEDIGDITADILITEYILVTNYVYLLI